MRQEVDSRLWVFKSQSLTVWAPLVGSVILPLPDIASAISLKSVQLFVYFWILLAYCNANFSVACTSELKPWLSDMTVLPGPTHPNLSGPFYLVFLVSTLLSVLFSYAMWQFLFLIEAFIPWMLDMKTALVGLLSTGCPWLSMFFWSALGPFSDQVAVVSLCSLKCCSVCCFIACSRHHLTVSFTDSFTLTCSRNTRLECTPFSFWAVSFKHFAVHVMN